MRRKMTGLYTMFAFMVIAAAIATTGCGGGSSAIAPTTTGTRISGVVTDNTVKGASVKLYSMKTGELVDTDTTGDDGSYDLSATLTNYDDDDVFYIIAEDGEVNGETVDFLKFKSIVGDNTSLKTAALADGAVTASEVPDLTVSNVSTAKVALVEKSTSITLSGAAVTAQQVTALVESEKEQEDENLGLVVKLAAAIKAAVDHSTDTTRTDSFASQDIDEYIKSTIVTTGGAVEVVGLDAELEAAGKDLEDDVMEDEDLIKSAVGDSGSTAVVTSSLDGTWYGYHVNTWGDEEKMGGPGLVTMVVSSTGCSTGQIQLTISGESTPICGDLTGSVLKFTIPSNEDGGKQIDAVGKISGTIVNGTYTEKNSAGESETGGIFKLGMSTESFAGTYDFEGKYQELFLSEAATTNGDTTGGEGDIEGQIIIDSSGNVSGTVQDLSDPQSQPQSLEGEINGPRITVKVTTGDGTPEDTNSLFLVFLINEAEVTGLFIEFDGDVDDPEDMNIEPYSGGKFTLSDITKK